jgi:redox-sensitive bicupin YhaK (pirin superfamily)
MMNDSIPSIPTVVERKPDFVTDLELERRARGFAVRSLRPHTAGGDLDPFLGADIYVMSEPFFPPHPHAGFSAVTWMLSHSEGGFVNRDSLGEHCHVEAGDLLWTQAGSGVVHEEVPITRGVDAAGLQVFVKAPAARELDPPEVLRLVARDVPIARFEGGQVRVLVGEALGVTSPLRPNHPVRMLEVLLEAKGTVSLVLP